MAAPTTEFGSDGTGTITATAEANGLLQPISPKIQNPRWRVGVSGTFTSCVLAVRGNFRGVSSSVYYPITGRNLTTGLNLSDSSSVSLTDSTNAAFEFDATGMEYGEVYVVSGTPTSLVVESRVEPAPAGGGSPIVVSAAANNATYSAGFTLNGASGANDITLTDNLADALTIQEGSTAYVTVVTTNSGEKVKFAKDLELNGAIDLSFVGTTGQPEITLTDNLADALSVKISGGADLLVATTTDSGEALGVKTRLSVGATSELTIASGVVTVTGNWHSVDTESDAASDDLDTISGGVAGQVLYLQANNSSRTVVVKDGTGNIKCGGDRSLDNAEDVIQLISDGTNWYEVAFASNGA